MNPCYPYLQATSDGLIECDCCGEGILEIKCPFKHQDKHPHEAVVDSVLPWDDNGTVIVCYEHHYYYEIQGQLAICERNTVTLFAGHHTVSKFLLTHIISVTQRWH